MNDTSLVGAAGTAAGGGGGGGTVDQGAAGVASWKVVEDNSASVKTAVEAIKLQLPPARGPQLEADSLSVTVVSQVASPDAPTETTLAAILTDTGNVSTASTNIDTKTPDLGQATMAGSTPVVIASDQSPVAVSGPLTDAQIRATALPVSLAGTLLADNTSTPTAPAVGSFGLLYDGTNWDLQRGDGSGRTVVAGNVAEGSAAALPITVGAVDTGGLSRRLAGEQVGSYLHLYVKTTNNVAVQAPSGAALALDSTLTGGTARIKTDGAAPTADATTGVYTRFPTVGTATTAFTSGVAQMKTSAGRARTIEVFYTGSTNSGLYVQLHAVKGTPTDSTFVDSWPINKTAPRLTIPSDHDIPCPAGMALAFSSTETTYTAATGEAGSAIIWGA